MATKHCNVFNSLLDSDSDSDGELSVPSLPLRGCPTNINSHIQNIYGLFDIERDIFPCSACSPAMSMEECGWECPHVSLSYRKLFPSWAAASAFYHERHSASECGGHCASHPLMDDNMFVWQNASLFNTTWGDLLLEQEEAYWNSLSSKQRAIILAEREAEERRKAEEAARAACEFQRILKEQAERQAYYETHVLPQKLAEKARRKAERLAQDSSSSSAFASLSSKASPPETRRSSVSSASLHHDETPSGGWGGCETSSSSSSSSSAPSPAPALPSSRKMVRCKPTERHRGDGGLMPCKFHCWDNVWGKLCTRPGKDGKVFAPGCSHSDCPYVHPDQPEWNDELKALFEKRIAALASRPPRHNGPRRH